MRIFSNFVRCEGKIHLFGRRVENRQYFVGELNYAADGETALVLPLPVSQKNRDRSVNIIDLTTYPKFFTDLDRIFPRGEKMKSASVLAYAEPIDIVYLPTLAEFKQIPEKYRVSGEFWSKLTQYQDHGFILILLPDTENRLTGLQPFALEFKTRLDERLFFPTVQISDCHLSPFAVFNHEIYYQGKKRLVSDCPSSHNVEDFVDLCRARSILQEGPVYRRILTGKYPNSDVTI